jgi:hypothetical protein
LVLQMQWSPVIVLFLVASLGGCLLPIQEDPTDPSGDSQAPSSSSSRTSATTRTVGSGPGPIGGDGNSTLPTNGTGAGNSTPFVREWATLGAATIRPGVQVLSDGGQCTSNFLFTSPDNRSVYIGFAAHCVTHNDPNSAEDGCDSASDPMDIGTKLDVEGAEHPATLVYTSWGTMQEQGGANAEECAFNDFAFAELDARDAAKANPAMLFFGGPTALADPGDVGMLDKVMTYGDSGLRAGLSALSPHEGYVIEAPGNHGWTTQVYTLPQGIPGDSGSGVITADGAALGVLVTISYGGGSNGVTTLANAMAYAAESGVPIDLATAGLIDGGRLPGL